MFRWVTDLCIQRCNRYQRATQQGRPPCGAPCSVSQKQNGPPTEGRPCRDYDTTHSPFILRADGSESSFKHCCKLAQGFMPSSIQRLNRATCSSGHAPSQGILPSASVE